MTNSKTLCQCCGKMMIPQVERSRGVFIGWQWGWRFGAGHAIDSICPFCLSPDWDGVKRPQPRSPMFKVGLVLVLLIIGSLGIDLIQHVYRLLGHAATFADFKSVISLAVIVLLVLLYKSLCTKR